MKIDVLRPEYIPQITEIEKECFSMPWSAEAFEQELASQVAHYFVAFENDIAAGYIGVHVILGEGYITNVAVKQEYRKNGIGKALIESVIEHCKNEGCAFVTLEVRKSNNIAISLYEKLGFKPVGVRKNYYEKPIEDGIIMTLDYNVKIAYQAHDKLEFPYSL